ncbi:MAG: CoA transferase [Archangiaceae bacterium]|nr:CoA transferase [Archangiaceae bacterium]
MSLPLEGLRVLDLSRLLPGPYATLVLADLGATVDKLEEPQGGDYIRAMGPGLFGALNRNKRSLTLDLKAHPAALKRLVKKYDVVVESFRPGVMEKLGLGYAALAAEHPPLIYVSISGYGQTGPDRLRAGHDLDYIARAGTLAYGGEKNGPPAVPGAQVGDISGSLFGLIGLFAALYERQRTGKGRLVDISMTETATAFIHMHLQARMLAGAEGTPLERGTDALNGAYACYRVYETKDGKYLAVGALEPKFFSAVCAVLQRPDLIENAYDTSGGSEQVRAELERIFKGRTRAEWLQAFAGTDCCVEPVNEGDEVLQDAQLKARGLFEGDQLRTPVLMGPLPRRAPPALGEHSAEVFTEAGFSPDEIAEMLKR